MTLQRSATASGRPARPRHRPARRTVSGWALLREFPYLLIAVGVAVPAVVSVWRSAAAGRVATNRLFSASDDAFYYFTVASRWADGQGSTFDGLHATNGYQPLWGWLTTLIFVVSPDAQTGAAGVITCSALLWMVAVALARLVAARLGAPGAGAVALAATAVVVFETWFDGMELPLVATTALAMIWLSLRGRALTGQRPVPREALALGVLGAVAVLSRLDTAAFVLLLGAAVLLRAPRDSRARVRLAALLLGPATAALTAYAVLEVAVFGSPVPVSGLAKELGRGGTPHWATVADFLTLSFGGRVHDVGVLLLVVVALALLVLRAPPRRHRGLAEATAPTRVLLVVTTGAQLLQVAFYTATSSWGGASWYDGLVVPALFLGATVALAAFPPRGRLPSSLRRLAVVVLVTLVVARTVALTATYAEPADTHDDPVAATTAAGAWADRALPPDARLAMGDWAGGFAFAVRRPVVQLEGLVEDRRYLDALARAQTTRYLDDAGVGYYVKLGDQTGVADGPDCERFTEPVYGAGPTLHVRVCDTDLLHTTPGLDGQGDVRIWRLEPWSLQP